MSSVKGKYIWIIGASSGIGHDLAVELAARGAILILSARRMDKLVALQEKIGTEHHIFECDVANIDHVRAVTQDIQNACPRLDSVIFMAAIYSPHTGERKDIGFIHNMIGVNLGGAFNVIETTQPIFEEQGRGQLVLCGSVAGYRGLPNGQPYCATKAAIINLAESLKVEWASKNIDVKVINPGFVRTPLTDKNDFPMPMMIASEEAAKAIVQGLESRSFEIHFPKRFTFIMKFLHLLPAPLYFMIARKMMK